MNTSNNKEAFELSPEELAQLGNGALSYIREIEGRDVIRLVGPQAPYRWAPDWWCYPEAVSRLDALWRAWEHLRHDGALGVSLWWRDHADHHLQILLDPAGPFMAATGQNRPGEPLPYTPPPEGLFPDLRTQPG